MIHFGPVKDNTLAVSPENYDPRAGEDLGFTGHPRFERWAVIPVEEFVEVREEVTVVYRRDDDHVHG
mgnify:FL=1